MFTRFHFNILPHSPPFSSPNPLPSLGVPRPGAHLHVRAPPPDMARKRIILSRVHSRAIVLFLITFLHFVASAAGEPDADALLKFRESLKDASALSNWDKSKPPCNGSMENWHGVLCEKGNVWGLKLENMGLSGVIDVDALSKMRELRTISVMHNNFDGPLPDLTKLRVLKTVYLSNNKFSGEIPANTFHGMASLKKLYLANNKFTGQIPTSLVELPKLIELMLKNNEFVGAIPQFPANRLKLFSVANNKLEGEIPSGLSNLPASSFEGNKGLCGGPVGQCIPPQPENDNGNKSGKGGHSIVTIVIVAVAVVLAMAALIVIVIILLRRQQSNQNPEAASSGANATQAQARATSRDLDRMEQGQATATAAAVTKSQELGKKPEQSVKLTFLRDDSGHFDMSDLLKASAEVLGSGVFGSTYKAALNEGKVMVVKRFKHMNKVSREEFNEHMRRLGRLNHQNVLSVVAYYYRKEEKLLVADYVENGSLAVHLHGNRSRGLPSPNWPTRLSIIKGVAKGLHYLYNELPSLIAPHGHLKSSNVLLDKSFKPYLTDYGLVPVVNQEHARDHMISYKSPEFKNTGRITKKSDVWSLGMLIIEILTGKFPSNFLQQGTGGDPDLAVWVESVVRDPAAAKAAVFDGDMEGTGHSQGEMMKLLKVALLLCSADADKRPDIKEAVEKIEEIKEKDADEDFYSSYTSETDMRSSRGLSDDFKSINI